MFFISQLKDCSKYRYDSLSKNINPLFVEGTIIGSVVHVIWLVLRVHRQRVAIMFAISTCIYVQRSNDRHVRSDSQLRRTRHRTMLYRYIWIVDTRPIRSLRSLHLSFETWGLASILSLCYISLANMFYMVHVYRESRDLIPVFEDIYRLKAEKYWFYDFCKI